MVNETLRECLQRLRKPANIETLHGYIAKTSFLSLLIVEIPREADYMNA
jgi:hypothetical protein